jgi:hypothetical protein
MESRLGVVGILLCGLDVGREEVGVGGLDVGGLEVGGFDGLGVLDGLVRGFDAWGLFREGRFAIGFREIGIGFREIGVSGTGGR